MDGLVPSCTLEVETVDVDAILWLIRDILRFNIIVDFVVETQFINGYDVLASIVLHRTSEECLREEESRDPISAWESIADPFSDEINSFVQVSDP